MTTQQPRGTLAHPGQFAPHPAREAIPLTGAGPRRAQIPSRAELRRERVARGMESKISFHADTADRFRQMRDGADYATNTAAMEALLAA